MREIVLDTETTGLSRAEDHVVEIGAVEMIDERLTGREFHVYIRPPKAMPKEAERVHGITDVFLRDKPPFEAVTDAFLAFVGADPIVAHNASFDVGMLNAEMKRLNRPLLANPVVDTMALSRKVRPGKKHTLDAICRDYGIDLKRRTKHGALLDAQILSEAYVELKGGRQRTMFAEPVGKAIQVDLLDVLAMPHDEMPVFRARITADELIDHLLFRAQIKDPVWAEYDVPDFA